LFIVIARWRADRPIYEVHRLQSPGLQVGNPDDEAVCEKSGTGTTPSQETIEFGLALMKTRLHYTQADSDFVR
jgi:hypothetical protein